MTDRTQQLLLEILLIQARYTPQEIERVGRMAVEGSFNAEAREVLALVERLSLSSKRTGRKKRADSLDPSEARERFLRGIKSPKTSAEIRRLKNIAKRLRLDEHRPSSELAERVSSEVRRMGDRELMEFLKPYRLEGPADEGYVGLANYLMHNK